MRILYSHRTLSADGQYVHIRCLTDALKARGHDVTLVGPDGETKAGEPGRLLDAGGGAPGLRAKLPKPAYEIAERLYSEAAAGRLMTAARRVRPDVLYERYNLFYHAGASVARRARLPFILEVNAPLAEERAANGGLGLPGMARTSEADIWRAADAVLPVTGVLAKRVIEAGVDPARVSVVQNGVEPDFLKPHDRYEAQARLGLAGRVVLGFTGFAREWHGLDRVVRFMAAHPERNLHFLLVGDGPVRAALEEGARAAGVADRMTVTGVVQREAVASHVAAFDVALQPAVVPYASPLKLFEYMAMGRAIVAPSTENIREVLADGRDAVLFDAAGKGAFETALRSLIDSPEARARLGSAARETLTREDYTWAGNAQRVERIAARLIERRR